MSSNDNKSLEDRLRDLEDKFAIQQLVCGYGYAMDGCNAEAVGSLYAEDGEYWISDTRGWEGREAIAGITRGEGHLGLVAAGVAHLSTLPYVVLDGDRAVATCHTAVFSHREDGFFIYRVSASRLQFSRKADGGWQIDHRQNYLLQGDPAGSKLLGRLNEGPKAA